METQTLIALARGTGTLLQELANSLETAEITRGLAEEDRDHVLRCLTEIDAASGDPTPDGALWPSQVAHRVIARLQGQSDARD